MAELHRGGDAELGEPRHVLRREALRVLDPVAEAARRPLVPRLLERVEGVRLARSPIACTATGQPARAPRRTMSASSSRLVISTPEPSSISAVCEPSVPSMKTFR